MKKILTIIVALAILIPSVTYAGIPATWTTGSTANTILPSKTGGVDPATFIPSYLSVGSTSPLTRSVNYVQENWCNQSYYCRLIMGNLNGSNTSSSDFVAQNASSTETSNYIDLGVNSNIYNDTTYTGFNGKAQGYLFTPVQGGALGIFMGSSSATTNLDLGSGCLLISCLRMRFTPAGLVGVGSTTPWGGFSINPNALGSGVPELVIGSSTATHFEVDGAGKVSIGTTTSDYAGNGVGDLKLLGGATHGIIFTGLSAQKSPSYINTDSADNLLISAGQGSGKNTCLGPFASGSYSALCITSAVQKFSIGNGGGAEVMRLQSSGLGIGTTSPWGFLSVNPNNLGSGVPEFVIGSSTATHLTVDGAGNLTESGQITTNTNGSVTAPSIVFGGRGTNWGIYSAGASSIGFALNGIQTHQFWQDGSIYLDGTAHQPELKLASLGWLDWADIGLSRGAAGKLYVGNGTQGNTTGTLVANTIGVGSTSPWRTLSVVGTMAVNGLSAATSKNAVCIDSVTKEIVDAGGTTCVTSSEKTKHDIHNLTTSEAVDALLKLRPVSFTYNDGSERRVGFIAEEVNKVEPRLVDLAHEDVNFAKASGVIKKGEPVTVEYGNVTALLVKAFQAQNEKFDTFKRSTEDNWQWIVIGIMALWIVRLEVKTRK